MPTATMPKITRESLMTLEAYAKARPEFRAKVLEHKKPRAVALGKHVTLLFEDEVTIRYQIQEMLRIEKIFEEEGIAHEVEAYAPLMPDGHNWKATMLLEYPDVNERRRELARLIGVMGEAAAEAGRDASAIQVTAGSAGIFGDDPIGDVHRLEEGHLVHRRRHLLFPPGYAGIPVPAMKPFVSP